MTFLEFIHDLIREGRQPATEGFWMTIDNAKAAINNRDSALAETLLTSIAKPGSDVEEFALRTLLLSAAISAGDVHCAQERSKALQQHPLYNEPLAQAVADSRIGIALRMMGCYDDALARQFAARTTFDSYGRELESALCMAEIAATMLSRGDAAGSLAAYLSSLDVIEREASESKRSVIRANIASALQRAGNSSEAERLYLLALQERPFSQLKPDRAMLLQNLAVIAKLDCRYTVAEERYTEALTCLGETGPYGQRVRLMHGLADLALRKGDNDIAKLQIACILSMEHGTLPLDVEAALESTSARLAAKDGDFVRAYASLNKALDVARLAGLLDERYEILTEALTYIDDPSHRHDLLEELVQVQSERLKAVPTSVNSIIGLRSRYEQEKAAREIERQQERTRVIVETQTRMLTHIGSVLHDSVGQDLTVLNMIVQQLDDAVQSGTMGDLGSSVANLKKLSHRLYTDTRSLSHLLTAGGLTGPGLSSALEEIARQITSVNSECTVETVVTGDLAAIDSETACSLFHLYQSLAQNILRHADATACIFQLLVSPDAIIASVEDNGIGYDVNMVTRGLGTRELFARAEFAKGTARIDTSPGHGTFVEITIPRSL